MSLPPSMYSGSNLGATGKSSAQNATGNIIPKGFRRGQLQQFTPEQMQLFSQLFGSVGPNSFLSRLAGGDQGAFEQMEAPAMRQLGALQGQLASRFSGMGARRSSGHNLAQGQLGTDFLERLQANRIGLQRQAIQDLMGLSGQLLGQRPYEQFAVKKQMPFWKQLLSGGVEAFAGGAGGSLTGGAGGAASGALSGWKKGANAGNDQDGDWDYDYFRPQNMY